MSTCENELLSSVDTCNFIRQPLHPNADGSCPSGYEKFADKRFYLPTCLQSLPSYSCDYNDPRLCSRPRLSTSSYPPLSYAYEPI